MKEKIHAIVALSWSPGGLYEGGTAVQERDAEANL